MRDSLQQTGPGRPSGSAVLGTEIEQATKWLKAAVAEGFGGVSSSAEAAELLAGVEELRRLATVLCVDAVDRVERSGAHIDHGHIDASVMFKHINLTSGVDAAVLKKIRRMLIDCDLINSVDTQHRRQPAQSLYTGEQLGGLSRRTHTTNTFSDRGLQPLCGLFDFGTQNSAR